MEGENYNPECEELIECFETQLMEVETIECLFPGDDELDIMNRQTLDDMKMICERFKSSSPADKDYRTALIKQANMLRCILLDIRLGIMLETESEMQEFVNVNFSLPRLYPKYPPCVFLSGDALNREQQGLWNANLSEYLKTIVTGEQMIYQIIEWLKDTGPVYLRTSSSQLKTEKDLPKKGLKENTKERSGALASMWLYMHHIYNKEKRKDIINWANELSLTGFSLPGKPGVVLVEGPVNNVEEYFVRLRRLSWKRMSCVHRELHYPANWERSFDGFEELCFGAHGGRDYHMDMGKFHLFLKDHNLGHMFTVLFGLKQT